MYLWINSSGKLLIDAETGKPWFCETCPCPEATPVILECCDEDNPGPQSIMIEITGLTNGNCASCTDFNDTYILEWVSGNLYRYDIGDTVCGGTNTYISIEFRCEIGGFGDETPPALNLRLSGDSLSNLVATPNSGVSFEGSCMFEPYANEAFCFESCWISGEMQLDSSAFPNELNVDNFTCGGTVIVTITPIWT